MSLLQSQTAMEFSQKNIEDEEKDSDVDQTSGWTDALDVTSSLLSLDAGLIQTIQPASTSEASSRGSGTRAFGSSRLCGYCRILQRLVSHLCLCIIRSFARIAKVFLCGSQHSGRRIHAWHRQDEAIGTAKAKKEKWITRATFIP